MNIGIIGLGYIGTVMGSILADNDHHVIGVDLNMQKVESIRNGQSPIKEPGLDNIIKRTVESGKLVATNNLTEAINSSEIGFICVGTPQKQNGDIDVSAVVKVCLEIAEIVHSNNILEYHIFIRSTLKPGTVNYIWSEIKKHYSISDRLTINLNPEFIREGSAVNDFYNPPYTVAAIQKDETKVILDRVYHFLKQEIYYTDIHVAEIIKYVNNAFHALKVVFTNEISSICKAYNINSHKVMELFRMDKILNISEYYLKPGFAYGGSCLPKDLSGLNKIAQEKNIDTPMLKSISASNQVQINNLKQFLLSQQHGSYGFVGVAFKNDTDDLRNSPIIEVVEFLLGKGKKVNIYDPEVEFAFLTGGNLEYLKTHFKHFENILTTNIDEFIANSEMIILHKKVDFDPLKLKNKLIIDLNYQDNFRDFANYYGINW